MVWCVMQKDRKCRNPKAMCWIRATKTSILAPDRYLWRMNLTSALKASLHPILQPAPMAAATEPCDVPLDILVDLLDDLPQDLATKLGCKTLQISAQPLDSTDDDTTDSTGGTGGPTTDMTNSSCYLTNRTPPVRDMGVWRQRCQPVRDSILASVATMSLCSDFAFGAAYICSSSALWSLCMASMVSWPNSSGSILAIFWKENNVAIWVSLSSFWISWLNSASRLFQDLPLSSASRFSALML